MHRHWASLLAVFATVTWSVAPALVDLVGCGVACGVTSVSAAPAAAALPAVVTAGDFGRRACCSAEDEPAGVPAESHRDPSQPSRCCLFFGCPITSVLDQSIQRATDDEQRMDLSPAPAPAFLDVVTRLDAPPEPWRPPPSQWHRGFPPPARTVVLLI